MRMGANENLMKARTKLNKRNKHKHLESEFIEGDYIVIKGSKISNFLLVPFMIYKINSFRHENIYNVHGFFFYISCFICYKVLKMD